LICDKIYKGKNNGEYGYSLFTYFSAK
jgi:hypothetical protein